MSGLDEPLVLYTEAYWQSQWDCACWVTLREKGLPFSRSVAILPGTRMPGELRDQAAAMRIPALQHGSFWLSSSPAIIEYLEETFPPPRWPSVWPRDVRDRARARHISLVCRTELWALRRERPAASIFYPAPAPLGAAAHADAEDLIASAARLLGDRAYLFGEFTISDLDVAFALQRLRRDEILPPGLIELIDRVWARPSVDEYVAHPRPPNPPVDDGR
jgi:glutathione S-transferase